MKILILCTGNTCRSQMAAGFLRKMDTELEIYSAGTNPGQQVHPLAVEVMKEKGIDISEETPQNVENFRHISFDYVITVCDEAKETCSVFYGKVKNRLHIGFDDPAEATGTLDEKKSVFLRIRNEIESRFTNLYRENIIKNKRETGSKAYFQNK